MSFIEHKTHKETVINPFIMQTALDYDLPVHIIENYYKKYGSTPMFYEKLEEYLKNRIID